MALTIKEIGELGIKRLDVIQVEGWSVPEDVFCKLKNEVGIFNEKDDGFVCWIEEIEEDEVLSEREKQYVRDIVSVSGVVEPAMISFMV